jgi:hypothetical protein
VVRDRLDTRHQVRLGRRKFEDADALQALQEQPQIR